MLYLAASPSFRNHSGSSHCWLKPFLLNLWLKQHGQQAWGGWTEGTVLQQPQQSQQGKGKDKGGSSTGCDTGKDKGNNPKGREKGKGKKGEGKTRRTALTAEEVKQHSRQNRENMSMSDTDPSSHSPYIPPRLTSDLPLLKRPASSSLPERDSLLEAGYLSFVVSLNSKHISESHNTQHTAHTTHQHTTLNTQRSFAKW